MIIGNIKGYDICKVTKKKIEMEHFLEELEESYPAVRDEMFEVLDHGGVIYGLKKKKICKAVYIFHKKADKKKKYLEFCKTYHLEEVADKMERFEKVLTEELKEKIAWGQYERVIWNDTEITLKKASVGGIFYPYLCLCMMLGLVYGLLINQVFYGITVGMCFFPLVRFLRKK